MTVNLKIGISATMFILMLMFFPTKVGGQPNMGILPVNISFVGSSVLKVQQLQIVAVELQNFIVDQLESNGRVNKISSEHILLLLKEMPSQNPETLTDEEYKTISKKENLDYLLKCSIKSIQAEGKNLTTQIQAIIYDGNNGKKFWEKDITTKKSISTQTLTEQVLINELFKLSFNEIIAEIKSLKY
jgi:hypothetical protein